MACYDLGSTIHETLADGPILWAIPLWRNSLVFHSHDKAGDRS